MQGNRRLFMRLTNLEVLFEEDKRCEVIRSGAAEIILPDWMKSLDLGEAVCWGLTSLSHFANGCF